MPKKAVPAVKQPAPDPSDCYERSHPEHESGQGRLDNNTKATPTSRPDKMPAAVTNAQDGGKQINAQAAATRPEQTERSGMEEEPLGWEKTANEVRLEPFKDPFFAEHVSASIDSFGSATPVKQIPPATKIHVA